MNSFPKDGPSSARPVNPHRRTLLGAALLSAPAAWLAGRVLPSLHAMPAALPNAPGDFIGVSRRLTGHAEIDANLANAAWDALVQREQDFSARFERLSTALKQAGALTFSQLDTSPIATDTALRSTAMAIIGAWYLGRVGVVKANSEDGPAFVTYTGALMWRPTLDVTVLPSYVRGKPGFWAQKPASIATD